MLKQISVTPAELMAPQKTDSEKPTPNSKISSRNLTAAMAVDRLLNFYPPLDVADPKEFITGIVALLAKYPAELILVAVDPSGGIPSRLKYLNSLAAIKEVCDDLYEPIAARMEREAVWNAPRALPRPGRTPEQQAAIDEQIARWKRRSE